MSEYLTSVMVDAHTADLLEQARRARLVHDAGTGRRRSSRLRSSTARLLVAVAVRLDNRLQPASVRSPASGVLT
jgi:hypothetical protein